MPTAQHIVMQLNAEVTHGPDVRRDKETAKKKIDIKAQALITILYFEFSTSYLVKKENAASPIMRPILILFATSSISDNLICTKHFQLQCDVTYSRVRTVLSNFQ